MHKKQAFAATAGAFIVIILAQNIGFASANPVPWPYRPNQEQPTLTIQSPQNNTVFACDAVDVWLNFTVTIPDSWKTGPLPPPYVGQVTSVKAYIDGDNIEHSQLWVGPQLRSDGSKAFAVKIASLAAGLHTLNVTILWETYYTGPAVNGSHIPHYLDDDGTVYKYPVAYSDIRYFTVEQSSQAIQEINTQPSASPNLAVPSSVIPLVAGAAVAIAVAVLFLIKKRTRF